MRRIAWSVYLAVTIACTAFILVAPALGLGSKYDFVLYRWIGLARGTAISILFWTTMALVAYEFLGLGIKKPARGPRFVAILLGVWRDCANIFTQLLTNTSPRSARRDKLIASATVAALSIAFAVFIYKSLTWYKLPIDQHWWQAFVDYGIEWRTPIFALGGNLLNNFGIEVPLKGRMLPIEGLAHVFPIGFRMAAATSLYFLFTAGLFWVIGALIGLNIVVRTFFAGLLALLLSIPTGLDEILWFIPPMFFTHQFILALWWGEAPVLMLTTATLFLVLGQQRHPAINAVVGCVFAAGVFTVVFSLAIGAVFFVPLLAAYCFGFLLTVENRRELAWKLGVSGLISVAMLAARVPQFVSNLYAYSFCSYYYEFCANAGPSFESDFLFASHLDDLRGLVVYLIAFAAIVAISYAVRGPVRRIAVAALVCEIAIIGGTAINRWLFEVPLAGAYAELGHAPMWAAFFVLTMIVVARFLDQRLAGLVQFVPLPLQTLARTAIGYRYFAYISLVALSIGNFALQQPKVEHYSDYPPHQPPSIELLKRELALSPGSPFRGRLMTLVLLDADKPTDLGEFYEVTANRYRRDLSNDHFLDVLPFNIPILNEYGYWPSPPAFGLFRVFFGREGESFGRAWFLLTQFDLRMARLMGVRMVVTDSATIPGGTLLLETKTGDTYLRVFRIDDANIGQYSPTKIRLITSATEAIRIMKEPSFDPRHQVIVEHEFSADLQPATSAVVTVNSGATLTVRAASLGRSLLVLPFEFSECLRFKAINGAGEILPVNLQQTGLLFENRIEAEISYRFGLFNDSRCRGQDLRRADNLRFKDMLLTNKRAVVIQRRPSLW